MGPSPAAAGARSRSHCDAASAAASAASLGETKVGASRAVRRSDEDDDQAIGSNRLDSGVSVGGSSVHGGDWAKASYLCEPRSHSRHFAAELCLNTNDPDAEGRTTAAVKWEFRAMYVTVSAARSFRAWSGKARWMVRLRATSTDRPKERLARLCLP